MILGSKFLTKVQAAILLLNDSIQRNTDALTVSLSKQEETNRLLRDLVAANKEFTNVIEHFFAVRKKLDIEESRRREKRELDNTPTGADSRY